MIREIDAKDEEMKQAKKKLKHNAEFVDLEARNSLRAGKVASSIIKCAHEFNHCGLRHAMINNN